MYEAREQSDILTELQQNVGSDASSYEGTFTYDVLASNSIEFSKEEVELEQAYKASFARSSWGEYLEMRAEEHGIFRKNAIKAIGKVTVSGNGIVPLGSIFQTGTGISFKTTKAVTISKSGDIPVECTTAGTVGNVAAKTITKIPMSIPGISSVMNAAAMHDGFNEEDDDSLFNRLLFKVRQPATSGNRNEYLQWATSVAGVGKAVIKPLWNGNGTVKVLITDVNGGPASSDLQSKVDPYLRPLYDALFDMLGAETYQKYLERGNIEVAPLAYMRGRTLDDSFIILDEAQNTSREQMKMFLTRLGFGSKIVITGDTTQIDLPADKTSGLKEAMRVLRDVEGIGICELTNADVVRHVMVQRIVEAYEKYETARNSGKGGKR